MPAASRKQFRPLYIGEWIARLNRKPRDVASKIGIGEAYLSQLISGEKKNPSARLLLDLSEELGLTVNDLYVRPPSAEAMKAAENLSPSQIAQLGRLLDQVKPKK